MLGHVGAWQELSEPWRVCLDEAWTAYRARSLPIGAAMVAPDGSIAGRGRNRIFESLCADAGHLFGHGLAHAEMNAMLSIDRAAVAPRECVLYTTLEPCALCVGALRMVGVREVHYLARDINAGSLALLETTDFMRRGNVRYTPAGRADLEQADVAMNVAALLELGSPDVVVDRWIVARVPGAELGRELFETGELRAWADRGDSVECVLDRLLRRVGPAAEVTPAEVKHHRGAAPLVVLVTGAPASGKSTVGRQLARALGLPFFAKDVFKETLFDALGWSDREWSRKLAVASMQLLYTCAAAELEVGRSLVLECNFLRAVRYAAAAGVTGAVRLSIRADRV